MVVILHLVRLLKMKISNFFLFLVLSLLYSSCETSSSGSGSGLSIDFNISSGEDIKKSCYDFSISSMGSPWRIVYCSKNSSILHSKLKTVVLATVSAYDETFSNWSEDSELSNIYEKGFDSKVCPSPLFMSALILAKEFYEASSGVFDASLGQNFFPGLSFSNDNKCFSSSSKKSIRLDFNGFVKGQAVGEVASKLLLMGLKDFYINAGNGNLAYRVSEPFRNHFFLEESLFPKGYGATYFLSQSKTHQTHEGKTHKHIYDLKRKTKEEEVSARVLCFSSFSKSAEWPRLGALSDALSTALVLDSKMKVPASCLRL